MLKPGPIRPGLNVLNGTLGQPERYPCRRTYWEIGGVGGPAGVAGSGCGAEAVTAAEAIGLDKDAAKSARLAIDSALSSGKAVAVAAMELAFWPAKIDTDALPTFIVPIRAEWAQHFFDEQLGSGLLFGLREELHLGAEGVYYCSPKHSHLRTPARILWYVSRGHAKNGSMEIKACSRLDGIEIGDAEAIFRRYRRLGVYSKRDILESVKGKSDRNRMALHFSLTERFLKPVGVEQLRRVGIRTPLMSPRKISAEQFASIYSFGFDVAHD